MIKFKIKDMKEKVVVVTGSNSGIGKQTALELGKKGFYVVLACRSEAKAQPVLDEIKANGGKGEIRLIDLSSMASTRAFAEALLKDFIRLDVVFNNAGILRSELSMTKDGFESQFQTNYLDHFLLTLLLLPLIIKSKGRVLIVSSLAHAWYPMNLEDINYQKEFNPRMGYGRSKLANLIFAKELTKRLKDYPDFSFNAIDPGVVATNICYNRENGKGKFLSTISKPFLTPVRKGAATSIYLASTSDNIGSGNLYKHCKIRPISEYAENEKTNQELFDLSCKLVGLDFADILTNLRQ